MKDRAGWIVLAVLACAVAAGGYLWLQQEKQPPPARPETAPNPQAKPAPPAHYPVPQAGDAVSLPTLDQSDTAMRTLLASLFGRNVFEEYFSPQAIVRRVVATVDNLPREKVAQRLMPVKRVAGPMLLTGEGAKRTISAENARRYLPYVAIAESVESGKLVDAYVSYYPLFQQAYKELGYPTEYFNNRLVEVIDHLLEAPEPKGPIELVQRKVLYEFSDPDLEARSAGQKIMLRIGSENASRVKAKLRELRRDLTRFTPKS